MSEQKPISLPAYIYYSLAAAWKLIQGNPRSMGYFDLSSDGFWKSFWAIALFLPLLIINYIYTRSSDVPQAIISSVIYYLTILPLTALVMYHFTRFMKIDENYAHMVIAFNWLFVLAYNIVEVLTLVLILLLPASEMVAVIIIVLNFYLLGYVVWSLFQKSLYIGGWYAFGVLVFQAVFNGTYRTLLLRYIDPEVFEYLRQVTNNPPS